MKILVTFALETEFAPWRKLAPFERISANQPEKKYHAQIGDARVRVALTGAGRLAAQRASNGIFGDVPDICIASGLAGALKSNYRPGDILAARAVAEIHGKKAIESDLGLVEAAADMGARIVERFAVSERVVSKAEEKRRLAEFGDAVEMESSYILAAAARQGIRSVAIRGVSDGVEADLPLDFERVLTPEGNVSVGSVVMQLAARPQRLPGLLRLARDSKSAAEALAIFLHAYVQSLARMPVAEGALKT